MNYAFHWIGVGTVFGSTIIAIVEFIKYLRSMRSDIDYQTFLNKELEKRMDRLNDKHHNLLNDLDKRFKDLEAKP